MTPMVSSPIHTASPPHTVSNLRRTRTVSNLRRTRTVSNPRPIRTVSNRSTTIHTLLSPIRTRHTPRPAAPRPVGGGGHRRSRDRPVDTTRRLP